MKKIEKMQIVHEFLQKKISKNLEENAGFLLSNKNLAYTYFFNNSSRYEGVFFPSKEKLFRVIAELSLEGEKVKTLINKFHFVEKISEKNRETFFMPFGYNSLIYELENEDWVELKLDIRGIYTQEKFGRYYEIFEENDKVIVKYKKIDEQTGKEEYETYLVINGAVNYEKIERWENVFYEHDKKRNSLPFELFVFNALKLKAKRLIFSFFDDKKKAIKESEHISKNLDKLKEKRREEIEILFKKNFKIKKLVPKEVSFAYKCCLNSLYQLTTKKGIIAGLPWFFQYWTRDELISVKNLTTLLKKRILIKNLKLLSKDGRLPNIIGSKETNADSVGWLFFRISESLDIFTKNEKRFIKIALLKSIYLIQKNYLKNDFFCNRKGETWMDSSFNDEGREGKRIEIQALFLNMLHLVYKLSKDKKYLILEQKLKRKVKENFWNNKKNKKKFLADGFGDFTIRPNIFIAYYLYPKLLTKNEWEKCFENSLKKLWLKWGGITTIDKEHSLFFKEHTGEDSKSYHRGDSWYFLNNLVALVLYKINKKKFNSYIKKILNASTKEILWMNAIGHHSELSSALSQKAEGCKSQAWSDALYIELINEIFR